MPFIGELLKYDTVSIVGVEKNSGKTECLNYILRALSAGHTRVAVTSIGLDGERSDQVTLSPKPEITLYQGMIFSTSEKHYARRDVTSEVLDVGRRATALGRVVTARALDRGKVLLSGPSTNLSLREWSASARGFGAQLCLIDGALSRVSSASPAVSQAMVLATGAAYSSNLSTLVRHTRFVCDKIALPLTSIADTDMMSAHKNGVWAIDSSHRLHDLGIASAFSPGEAVGDIFGHGNDFFVAGALGNRFVKMIMNGKRSEGARIVVGDFTRIFVEPGLFYEFISKGGKIEVLHRSHLVAVCVNPVSPNGYSLDPGELSDAMRAQLRVPVYNLREEEVA